MTCSLRWTTSLSATCLHAAACQWEAIPAADPLVAEALAQPAAQLVHELETAGLPPQEVLGSLVNLAADYENNRELVTRVLTKRYGLNAAQAAATTPLAGAISDLEAALLRTHPQLAQELAVRVRPLREQWEARGPGLLRAMTRLAPEDVITESAQVVLVAPYAGGHGRAHLRTNRITLEAVLYHPLPDLPEPLRLAWLLAQLTGDLPRFADAIPRGDLETVVAAAMIPPTLAAAEQVELARCDEPTLALALTAWRTSLAPEVAPTLLAWWTTYCDGAISWHVALAALAEMIDAGRN
jgi:hypothetical protein